MLNLSLFFTTLPARRLALMLGLYGLCSGGLLAQPATDQTAEQQKTKISQKEATPSANSTDTGSKSSGAESENVDPAQKQPALDPVKSGTSDPELQAEKAHPLLLRAEEHYFHKRYHVALRLLKKVLEEDPENARAYLYTGDIYLIQQNYGLAEEHFQIAMELAENPAREWFRLGQVRLLRKKPESALEAFDKSLAAGPALYINHFYKGLVYYNLLQDKDKTIASWELYRKLVPAAPQGPEIDKAIAILKQPDFKFPERSTDPCIQLPTGKETKVPYKPAKDADQKTNDTGAEPIDIDDL